MYVKLVHSSNFAITCLVTTAPGPTNSRPHHQLQPLSSTLCPTTNYQHALNYIQLRAHLHFDFRINIDIASDRYWISQSIRIPQCKPIFGKSFSTSFRMKKIVLVLGATGTQGRCHTIYEYYYALPLSF